MKSSRREVGSGLWVFLSMELKSMLKDENTNGGYTNEAYLSIQPFPTGPTSL